MSRSIAMLTPPARADALPAPPSADGVLAEHVRRALRAAGYGPLRGIDVCVRAGVVRLSGCVPSYHLKQVAQAAAAAVPGVSYVCNDVEVV